MDNNPLALAQTLIALIRDEQACPLDQEEVRALKHLCLAMVALLSQGN
jgi:hypothetical protein